MMHSATILLVTLLSSATMESECSGDSSRLRWVPPVPTEGSVVQFIVTPARDEPLGGGGVSVHGEVADEPLHFLSEDGVVFRALAPIPVGSPDTLVVPLSIEGEGHGSERLLARVPVARVRSGILELNVDPRFISPPDSEIPRILEERDLVISVSRRSHYTPRLWQSSFLRPRAGRITAGFGQRREFNGELRSLHMGVDLAGAAGTPVIASNDGVIVIVHDFYYAGTAIHIDHGSGLTTAYMHLSETAVSVGDTVARGEVIGKVGATGRVTGPHLHWHAKYGLVTVNPLTLLELQATDLAPDG